MRNLKLFEDFESELDEEVKFNNKQNKSYDIDGEKVWVPRSPALVGVVIANYKNDDYVLIGERGTGAADNRGKWNLPCGYLDRDENGVEGIYREIWEETGVYIPRIIKNNEILKNDMEDQPFYVNTDIRENRQNISLSYGLYFKTDKLPKLSDKNSEPDEVGDIKWVKISDLGNYEFAFKHDRRITMYYNKIK